MFKLYSFAKKIVYDHFEGIHNYFGFTECVDASLGIFLNRRMAVQVVATTHHPHDNLFVGTVVHPSPAIQFLNVEIK
jgi:hypothetical protein